MSSSDVDRGRSPILPAVAGLAVFVLVLVGAIATVVLVTRAGEGAAKAVTVHATLKEWSIVADKSVPAGDVTFVVTNAGTMEHEMLVLQTDVPASQLPITDAGDPPVPVTTGADKVDEESSVGETGAPNLAPGEVRTFTIPNMAPGSYVLVCNLAGHYKLGMWAAFTVTG